MLVEKSNLDQVTEVVFRFGHFRCSLDRRHVNIRANKLITTAAY